MKFFITDLVTFTKEIRNEKLHFLCSVKSCSKNAKREIFNSK